MAYRQNKANADAAGGSASGALAPPGGRGKAGAGNIQDLSVYLEDFCSAAKNVPAEIKRYFNLIHSLDTKVHDLREKINSDSSTYSSAKNKSTPEMVELKKAIDESQTRCLECSDEKVSAAQMCLELVSGRLKQLDDDISNIDEFMAANQAQADDGEEDAPGRGAAAAAAAPMGAVASGGPAGMRDKKRKAQAQGNNGLEPWLHEGAFVEVEWDKDWWQAVVKKIKLKQGGGGAMGGPMRGPQQGQVLVSYVGGDENEDEWIPLAGGRLRPPQEDFHQQEAAAGEAPLDVLAEVPATPLPGRGGGYGLGRY